VAVVEFREGCSAAVGAAGGTLTLQAVQLDWPLGGRPAACLLAHGCPMGPTGVYGLAAGRGWASLLGAVA